MDLKCFDRIAVEEPIVAKDRIGAKYVLELGGRKQEFRLLNSYGEDISSDRVWDFARAAVVLPAVNYGLFADRIEFDFELDRMDLKLFNYMTEATARDIFVNMIVRRTGYVKDQFLPDPDKVGPKDARPRCVVSARRLSQQGSSISGLDYRKNAVMSSGGKESLLTYSVLKDMGQDVYPCFLNESGGHWRTAMTAFRGLRGNDPNTKRVWSNVDRLFSFIDRSMRILDERRVRHKSDTYPIRLFFFEYYVFSFLPLFYKYGIGNVNIGDELDDPLTMESEFKGIKHYGAVYDQTQEFDDYMTGWFNERGFNFKQWSAVRPLSGLVEERILHRRYPQMFQLQRSCHSVVRHEEKLVPCGKCKKCLGVLTYLYANGIDPAIIGYRANSAREHARLLSTVTLNLDKDEHEHAKYLANRLSGLRLEGGVAHDHVETLHFDRSCSRPDVVPRELWGIYRIYEKYSKGYSVIKSGRWVKVTKEEALSV